MLVWDLVLADALAVLTVLTVLTALVASVVLTALVVLVAHVAPDVAAVAVVVAAAKPISSFILLFEKVPCIVAGVFLYKIRHNGQIAVHTMIVVVLLNIYGYKG